MSLSLLKDEMPQVGTNCICIIYKALLWGCKVQKKDSFYQFDAEHNLCEVRGDILLKVSFGEVNVSDFTKWLSSFTYDEFLVISADLTLILINQSGDIKK